MATLSRILIYPIKSFDPVDVGEATVLPSGALEHDRQFALYDDQGKWVNGKRTPKVHAIRSKFDLAARRITLQAGDRSASFLLDSDREVLERWLGDYFGQAIQLRENAEAGFPDDTEAPGPTIIGESTLQEVAGWFPGLTVEDARLRFRANLEIEGEEPFWEDRLYGEEGSPVRFRIGSVELAGTNPCARCIVPTRSPSDGQRYPEFGRIFEERRYETLPYWATRSRFDHFYRLAVNTRLPSAAGGVIRVGDEVLLGE
jgi:uncharacterized protein YcbX